MFRKQIDNLKTNHRGVYVLTDNSFKPFSRMSTEPGGNAVARAEPVCYSLSYNFYSTIFGLYVREWCGLYKLKVFSP